MIRTAGGSYSYETFDEYTGSPSPRRASTELTYLAFPVGFRICPVAHSLGPFLAMGTDVAYLLSYYQRVSAPNSNAVYSDHNRSRARRWGLAGFVTLGVGRSLARNRLFAELTYRHGVPPFQRSNWGGDAPDDGTDRALSLSLGAWL